MTFGVLAALFGVGLLVGFVSGLIGIGGGVLIVPFLYFFYEHSAWSGWIIAPGMEATIAHATSLAVILPTGLAAARAHHRFGAVEWRAALPIAAVAAVAAIAGANLAVMLRPELLKLMFGALLLVAAVNLTRGTPQREGEQLRLTKPVVIGSGIAVGLMSSMLGVGGGILAIPLLVYVIGLDMRKVAATSIAIVGITAASGAVTYAIAGIGDPGRPPGSIGYIHLVAAIPILLASLLTVKLGAAANRRMNTRQLHLLFAALFFLLGAQLIIENAGRLL